jgi:hypothetical protein
VTDPQQEGKVRNRIVNPRLFRVRNKKETEDKSSWTTEEKAQKQGSEENRRERRCKEERIRQCTISLSDKRSGIYDQKKRSGKTIEINNRIVKTAEAVKDRIVSDRKKIEKLQIIR